MPVYTASCPHYDELDVKTRTVLAINGLDNVKGLEK